MRLRRAEKMPISQNQATRIRNDITTYQPDFPHLS
jgi:hypothetical protein